MGRKIRPGLAIAFVATIFMGGAVRGIGATGRLFDEGGGDGPQVTFTKWVLDGGPKMAGFTGGDAVGTFTGEILSSKTTTTSPFVNFIFSIEAVYDIHAGSHSFTALIKGGENADGKAFLDGRVLNGWHVGSSVHVTFQAKTNCPGAPAGLCFEGVIHIAAEADHD